MKDKEWRAFVDELQRQAERQIRDAHTIREWAERERDAAWDEVDRIKGALRQVRELLSEWLDDHDTYDD